MNHSNKTWKLSSKQKEFLEVMERNKFSCLAGQGRSGKTLAIVYYLFKRAIKYPNTNHVCFRNTLTSAVDGLWKISVKEVIKNFFPALPLMSGFKMNESSHEITFHNGSRIVLKGLDDKERSAKILSTQWATIFADEAHLIDYEYIGLLLTRLPQPMNVDYKVKFIFANNWCPKTHWLKEFFVDGLNPETKSPHGFQTEIISSQTSDNPYIDAEEYINTLNSGGDRRSRLMCAGEDFYEKIEGALWVPSMILRSPTPDKLEKIVLAFDPAVTNNKNSDEHGICVAGCKFNKEKNHNEFFVLNCFEKKSDINDIAKEVISLYYHYNCTKLLYEENAGGKWIESLIKNHAKDVYLEGVRAKVGKLLRAEPVTALYSNGLVYHCNKFQKLEDQMCCYDGSGDSPNALDALVYAIGNLNQKRVARGFV